MLETLTPGNILVFLALAIVIRYFMPSIRTFRQKLWATEGKNRGAWTMYERVRDADQYDRYAEKIHDMLFNDFHKGVIDGEEYQRWMKRFSWMPGLKAQPIEKPKEAIKRRLTHRFDLNGTRISLYTNNDTVHNKYYPNFRNYVEESTHGLLRSNALPSA